MKSDSQAFMIFKKCPNLLHAFFAYKSEAGYAFNAPVVKDVRKSFDGVFEPEDASEPTFVIEFQMQYDPSIFVRLMIELGLYQYEKMEREAQGIVIFPKKRDLKTCRWSKLVDDCPWLVKVLYLNEAVEREPLLKATFGPFLEENEAIIEASAKEWYQTIHRSEYRATLETVFFSWLFARLNKGKEVPMWVQSLLDTDLEEIPYFRELEERGKKLGITIGEERGEERGKAIGIAIGKIQAIQELRGFPVDSEETLRKLSPESLQAKLDQLKSLPIGQA